jgi:hypothetical protein
LKRRGALQSRYIRHHTYALSVVAPVLQDRILDGDYSKVNIKQYVSELTHLKTEEKKLLTENAVSVPSVFGGGLGTLKVCPIHLELRADAKPYHSRLFPVLQTLYSTTKTEIEQLIKIGVLKFNNESEWAAPTFVQPKKTGDVWILTDFRKLNKAICCKPFHLPKISDLLQKLQGWAIIIYPLMTRVRNCVQRYCLGANTSSQTRS